MMIRNSSLAAIFLVLSFFGYGQDKYSDVILDTYYSNSYPGFSDFYGQGNGGTLGLIDPAVCLGNNYSFVCLSKDSYITVGFVDNIIIDAPGQDDIYIDEVGNGEEYADIYLSGDNGVTFTYYGQINGSGNTGIDLNTIGYTGIVNAVKIVGLDNNGGAPGFDLMRIYGLDGANCMTNADVNLQDVCQDSIFDLTGLYDGYWESNYLIDNVLSTMDTGVVELMHIVTDPVFGCPNDTAMIPVHITPCDCEGEAYGGRIVDQCGECLLPTNPAFDACVDCSGVPFGLSIMDLCNQCLLPNDTLFNDCVDCAGVPFGISEIDQCGVCLLPTDTAFNACVDCAGVPFGLSVMDLCNQCLLPGDTLFNDCVDCAGVPFGISEIDRCEQCLSPSDAQWDACVDCAGVPWGEKVLDRCDQCLLESDSLFNYCLDCAGVPFGESLIDLCHNCILPTDSRICTEKTIFYRPNAFSPNSDGVNDYFELHTRDGVDGQILEYSIFSRWGELIYQAKNFPTYSNDQWWDGKVNGRKARTGVYIYHMLIQLETGKVLNYSGDVTVVR